MPDFRVQPPYEESISGQADGDRPSQRLLEMELIHRWSTRTFQSFMDLMEEPEEVHAWQTAVIEEALEHDFLMSGVLAFTALHTAHMKSGPTADRYFLQALEYNDVASKSFRSALTRLSAENHCAVFAFSIINMGITLALSQFPMSNHPHDSFLGYFKTFLHMMKATLSIYIETQYLLALGPFKALPKHYVLDNDTDNLDPDTKTAFNLLLQENGEIHNRPDSIDQPRQLYEPLQEIIRRLRSSSKLPRSDRKHFLMVWTTEVPSIFLQALDADDPVALLTLMYWGALFDEFCDDKWWIGHSGRSLVSELSFILTAQKRDRTHLLQWPRAKVGLRAMAKAYNHTSASR